MVVDHAQQRFDARLRAVGAAERMRVHATMYSEAFTLVWAAADRAGPMTELERARFLLRRLYPDLEGQRLDAIMSDLERGWASGTWTGFRRRSSDP